MVFLLVTMLCGCASSHPEVSSDKLTPVNPTEINTENQSMPEPDGADAVPSDAPQKDTFEDLNRHFFKMNRHMDRNVIRPVAQTYAEYVPGAIRTGVHNLLKLANMPVIFANDVLQARFEDAGESLTRTVTNAVFGLGVYDAAGAFGIPGHSNDFGRTLGVWGWTQPSYLMLPVLGPTSSRDVVGFAGNLAMDPAIVLQYPYFLWVLAGRKAIELLDTRARLIPAIETLERQSVDPYATVRSLYLQHRKAQINDAKSNNP